MNPRPRVRSSDSGLICSDAGGTINADFLAGTLANESLGIGGVSIIRANKRGIVPLPRLLSKFSYRETNRWQSLTDGNADRIFIGCSGDRERKRKNS